MNNERLAGLSTSSVLYGIIGLASIGVGLAVVCLGAPLEDATMVFYLTLVASVAIVVACRKNTVLFVISLILAYANYSACLLNTAPPYYGYDTAYANTDLSLQAMAVVLLFSGVLLLALPRQVNRYDDAGIWVKFQSRYSFFIVVAICVLLVGIFFTCSSGFAVVDGRAENNSIFEYAYIFFILGFLISGNSPTQRAMLILVACLYLAQAFFGGNRASVLATAMLLLVVYLAPRSSWKTILPLVAVGILLMQAIGYFRFEEGNAIFRLFDAFGETVQNGFCWDTATYAFHQSIVFLRVRAQLPTGDLLYLLRQWVLSWVLGNGFVPDSVLAVYCSNFYQGLGGGFLPVFGFFYLGIPGVVLMALAVAFWFRMINRISQIKSSLFTVLTLGVAVTFCRWYLYSPSPLTSGCVYLAICYGLVSLFLTGGTQSALLPMAAYFKRLFGIKRRGPAGGGSFLKAASSLSLPKPGGRKSSGRKANEAVAGAAPLAAVAATGAGGSEPGGKKPGKKGGHGAFYKNTAWQYGLQMIKYLFPLITLPYLTRVLEPEGYAIYAYVLSFMGFVQVFVDFGFNLSGTKRIADAKGLREENRAIGAVMQARLLLCLVAAAVVFVVASFIPLMAANMAYTALAFVAVCGKALAPDFVFQGHEQMGPITTRYLASKLVSTVLTFVLVHSIGDILWVPILDILSSAIALAWSFVAAKRLFGTTIEPVPWADSLHELKVSGLYCFSNIAAQVFSSFTTLFVGIAVTDAAQVSYWSLAMTAITAVQQLYNPIVNSLYPHMVKSKDFGFARKIALIALPVVLVGTVAFALLHNVVFLVLGGKGYLSGSWIAAALSPVLLFGFFNLLFGWPVLGAAGKIREITATTVGGSLFCVASLLIAYALGQAMLPAICALRCITEALLFISRAWCSRGIVFGAAPHGAAALEPATTQGVKADAAEAAEALAEEAAEAAGDTTTEVAQAAAGVAATGAAAGLAGSAAAAAANKTTEDAKMPIEEDSMKGAAELARQAAYGAAATGAVPAGAAAAPVAAALQQAVQDFATAAFAAPPAVASAAATTPEPMDPAAAVAGARAAFAAVSAPVEDPEAYASAEGALANGYAAESLDEGAAAAASVPVAAMAADRVASVTEAAPFEAAAVESAPLEAAPVAAASFETAPAVVDETSGEAGLAGLAFGQNADEPVAGADQVFAGVAAGTDASPAEQPQEAPLASADAPQNGSAEDAGAMSSDALQEEPVAGGDGSADAQASVEAAASGAPESVPASAEPELQAPQGTSDAGQGAAVASDSTPAAMAAAAAPLAGVAAAMPVRQKQGAAFSQAAAARRINTRAAAIADPSASGPEGKDVAVSSDVLFKRLLRFAAVLLLGGGLAAAAFGYGSHLGRAQAAGYSPWLAPFGLGDVLAYFPLSCASLSGAYLLLRGPSRAWRGLAQGAYAKNLRFAVGFVAVLALGTAIGAALAGLCKESPLAQALVPTGFAVLAVAACFALGRLQSEPSLFCIVLGALFAAMLLVALACAALMPLWAKSAPAMYALACVALVLAALACSRYAMGAGDEAYQVRASTVKGALALALVAAVLVLLAGFAGEAWFGAGASELTLVEAASGDDAQGTAYTVLDVSDDGKVLVQRKDAAGQEPSADEAGGGVSDQGQADAGSQAEGEDVSEQAMPEQPADEQANDQAMDEQTADAQDDAQSAGGQAADYAAEPQASDEDAQAQSVVEVYDGNSEQASGDVWNGAGGSEG